MDCGIKYMSSPWLRQGKAPARTPHCANWKARAETVATPQTSWVPETRLETSGQDNPWTGKRLAQVNDKVLGFKSLEFPDLLVSVG